MTQDEIRLAAMTDFRKISDMYPPQTMSEEVEMCRRLAGDRERLEKELVMRNLGFAVMFANKYNVRGESYDDKVMRAVVGLSNAAKSFDPGTGVRFVSYAGYHIQTAFRDLFQGTLNSAKMHQLTVSVYDAPVRNQSGDSTGSTMADVDLRDVSSAGWLTIDPASEDKRSAGEREYDELVRWIINRNFGDYPNGHRRMLFLKLKGFTLEAIGKMNGDLSREGVRQVLDPMISKLRNEIHGGSDEMAMAVSQSTANRAYRTCMVSHEVVSEFLRTNGIRIVSVCETEDERIERLMDEYDIAERELRALCQVPTDDAQLRVMRKVFEACAVRKLTCKTAAQRLCIPQTYVRFLLDRSVRMLKIHKAGVLEKNCEELGFRRVADELSLEVRKGSGSRVKKGEKLKDVMIARSPYRGCFYSQEAYFRFGHRVSRKDAITVRELRLLVHIGSLPVVSLNRAERLMARTKGHAGSAVRCASVCSGAIGGAEPNVSTAAARTVVAADTFR